MAESRIQLVLTWENNVQFTMTSKKGLENPYTIVKTDENNHISDIWDILAQVCRIYFDKTLKSIGDEMKS